MTVRVGGDSVDVLVPPEATWRDVKERALSVRCRATSPRAACWHHAHLTRPFVQEYARLLARRMSVLVSGTEAPEDCMVLGTTTTDGDGVVKLAEPREL